MTAKAASIAWPFLMTLVGVGLAAVVGSCDGTTACQAASFTTGPIILIVIVITGLAAGRLSPTTGVGLAAMLAATGLVLAATIATDRWYQPTGPGGRTLDRDVVAGLFLTVLAAGTMLPGFFIGRAWRTRSALAKLVAARDAGAIGAEEYQRGLVSLGRARTPDQALPGQRCGRCGKALSPVWRGSCKHCGARYDEVAPVPNAASPTSDPPRA